MGVIEILALLAGGYLILKSGALTGGASAMSPSPGPLYSTQPGMQLPPGSGFNTSSSILSGISSGVGSLTSPSNSQDSGSSGPSTGTVLAGVGAAIVSAIGISLLAAHQQRKKQATNENSAMNLGVTGFDRDLKVVNEAFNSGQINQVQAIQLVQQIMKQYWDLVAAHIQPGRNGCAGGSACATTVRRPANYCSGNIGAACCVGCLDLYDSIYGTLYSSAEGGTPGVLYAIRNGGDSYILKVFGSKYGGITREGYHLMWAKHA